MYVVAQVTAQVSGMFRGLAASDLCIFSVFVNCTSIVLPTLTTWNELHKETRTAVAATYLPYYRDQCYKTQWKQKTDKHFVALFGLKKIQL